MKTLCIAHGSSCVDGYAASWVVHRALGDGVEFVYASYDEDPPDCTRVSNKDGGTLGKLGKDYHLACNALAGRDVLIVDFSYPIAVLREMAKEARTVLVLDHHKSAAEDLKPITGLVTERIPWSGRNSWLNKETWPDGMLELAAIFDMERSGAGLTWDYFNPGQLRPWFINLVEDRDLWKFTDDRSRPFHAAVTSYPLDFVLWDRLVQDKYGIATGAGSFAYDLIKEGTGILRKHDLDVQTVIRTTRRTMVIGGDRVPVCNCPPWLASDVGHALTEPQPGNYYTDCVTIRDGKTVTPVFAATYYDRDGKRNFSLRSRPEGRDVSKVCALYQGGGHHGAGGFEASPGWEGEE